MTMANIEHKNTHGDFIWYELMTSDADAAQGFYSGLLNWRFADSGHEGMDYRLFSSDGPPVGGLLELTTEMRNNGAQPMWAGYIGVDDVDGSVVSIKSSGGQVLLEPWDIPDVGRIAFVADPQGASFYVMREAGDQPSESFAAHEPRLGHCAWNELCTSDPAAAKQFYGELFGWVESESMDMGPAGKYEMFRNGADRDFMFGGFMKKPDETPVSMWNYYFRVQKIDPAADYVKQNNGKIINGPMEIPGGEFVFNATDPQGAMFSLIGAK